MLPCDVLGVAIICIGCWTNCVVCDVTGFSIGTNNINIKIFIETYLIQNKV